MLVFENLSISLEIVTDGVKLQELEDLDSKQELEESKDEGKESSNNSVGEEDTKFSTF
jgi:hypothetical protein